MSEMVEEVQEDLIIEGLNITQGVATIEEQGYIVVPDFITSKEIDKIKEAFLSEVYITEMRAIGTQTGRTWRAHNLLAKTRAVDYLFLDKRVRGLVEGVLGPRTQVNVTTLFNVLPGWRPDSSYIRTMVYGQSSDPILTLFAMRLLR